MPVSYEQCVLSGRGLCVGLITRLEKSYRASCECERDILIMRRSWPTRGYCATENKSKIQKKKDDELKVTYLTSFDTDNTNFTSFCRMHCRY